MNKSVFLFYTFLLLGAVSNYKAQSVLSVPSQHASIQAALSVASANDTIEIAPGVYSGPLNTNNVVSVPLVIRGTRINGTVGMATIDCGNVPNTRAFTLLGNIIGDVVIEDIKFINGNISLPAPQVTAPHLNLNVQSLVYLDCSQSNLNRSRGGAILIASTADVVIKDCIFEDNVAEDGGAISIAHCFPNGEINIENNTFRRNLTNVSNLDRGGAISGTPSSANLISIVDNVFDTCRMVTTTFPSPNLAYGGGAIYLEASDNGTSAVLANAIIERNIFRGNTSGNDGGALLVRGFRQLEIYNNAFTGNTSNRGATVLNIIQRPGDSCIIRNNTIENNPLTSANTPLILFNNHLYNTAGVQPRNFMDNNIIKPDAGQVTMVNGAGPSNYTNTSVRNNNINLSSVIGTFTLSNNYNLPSTYVNYPNYVLGDFHQLQGSPDIDAGFPLSLPSIDIDEARRDVSGPDSGVDEFNIGGKIYAPELVNKIATKNDTLRLNVVSVPNSIVVVGFGLNRIPPTPVPGLVGLLEIDLLLGYLFTSFAVTDSNGFVQVKVFLDTARNNGTFYTQVATLDSTGTIHMGNTIEVRVRD